MANKVRKQSAQETGLSEGELIRRALDRYTAAGQPVRGDRTLWDEELAYIDRLISQGPVAGKRTWSRAELYAE